MTEALPRVILIHFAFILVATIITHQQRAHLVGPGQILHDEAKAILYEKDFERYHDWRRYTYSASESAKGFAFAWRLLLLSWGALYGCMSLSALSRSPDQVRDLQAVATMCNNVATLMMLVCYQHMSFITSDIKPPPPKKAEDSAAKKNPAPGQRRVKLGWTWGLGAFFIIAACAGDFASMSSSHSAHEAHKLFELLSGIGAAIVFGCLVGSFDSHLIDANPLVLPALYLYVAIQPAWILADSTSPVSTSLSPESIKLAILLLALALKIFFCLFISWLLQTERLFFYLANARLVLANVSKSWADATKQKNAVPERLRPSSPWRKAVVFAVISAGIGGSTLFAARATPAEPRLVLFGSDNVVAHLKHRQAFDRMDPLYIDVPSDKAIDQIFATFCYGAANNDEHDRIAAIALASNGPEHLREQIKKSTSFGVPQAALEKNYFLVLEVARLPMLALYRDTEPSVVPVRRSPVPPQCGASSALGQEQHNVIDVKELFMLFHSAQSSIKFYGPENESGTRGTLLPVVSRLDLKFEGIDFRPGPVDVDMFGGPKAGAFLAVMSDILPSSKKQRDTALPGDIVSCEALKEKHINVAMIVDENKKPICARHVMVMKIAQTEEQDHFRIVNPDECELVRRLARGDVDSSCKLQDNVASASHVIERAADEIVSSSHLLDCER